MKLVARFALLGVFLTQPAWAAEVFLHVFFEEAPLKSVDVSIDSNSLGETDGRGALSVEMGIGRHALDLSFDGTRIAVVKFEVTDADTQEVEIEVSYSRAAPEPEILVKTFTGGESGGASGILSGTVTDSDGNPVAGARVSSAGISTETLADGSFGMSLPRGLQTVTIEHPDFSTTELGGIRIFSGVGVTAVVEMMEAAASGSPGTSTAPVEELLVLGTFNPTDTAVGTERYATTITDALDLEQLARFGDSDVASALTRIVGVSIADDKYATVRGLDGRYISSTLNGVLMPSTDPLRRDVQLDLFPSNILGGLEIQKSFSPELLATTTGGSVKIKTAGLPDERVRKIGISTAYNFEFTGDDVLSYRGSETDKYGWDNDLRDLPGGVLEGTDGGTRLTVCPPGVTDGCTSQLDAARLAVQLQDDYNVEDDDANMDFGVSAAYGDRFSVESGEVGFYAAANYKSSASDRGDADLDDLGDVVGGYRRTRESTATSAYLVGGWEFREADEILSKTMFLHNSDDTVRVEEGVDREDNNVNETILEWVEREFWTQQFIGKHEFYLGDDPLSVDWRLAYSETSREEPDRRQYTYLNDQLSTSAFERRWSDLDEDSSDAVLDLSYPVNWNDSIVTDFKVGGLYSDKSRDVELYRFSITGGSRFDQTLFSVDQNLEEALSYNNAAIDVWRLRPTTTTTDSYSADEEYTAYYIGTTTEFGDDWTFSIGSRYEEFEQTLEYPNDETATPEPLDVDDWYLSSQLTYRLGESWQFRAGYSETVSYPGLIERAESLVYDPETDDPIFGNPDLKASTIDNYDLRVEYYFDNDDSISLAVFYKEIDLPVERAVPDASGSAADGITFRNSESADLQGVELDGYKTVFDDGDHVVFVSGNVTYIDSEVNLDEDGIRLEGEDADGRQLQGQAEWLGNLQIGYDHYPTEQKVTLLVNYYDDMIFRVGRGSVDDEYKASRTVVDLNYEKLWGESLTLKVQLKNLLDDEVEYERGNATIESYNEGTSISVGLTYEFL